MPPSLGEEDISSVSPAHARNKQGTVLLPEVLKLGHLNGGFVGLNVGSVEGCDGRKETNCTEDSTDGDVVGCGVGALVTKIAVRFVKLMLPRPVTGSQPGPAVKPAEQQVALPLPPFTQHLLCPDVTS